MKQSIEDKLKQVDPTASCTYFPMEGQYMVFTNSKIECIGPPIILTGNFHYSREAALIEAINVLQKD